MFAKVLKPFAYAADHTTVRQLAVGDVLDFDDLVAPGLEAEGYIGPTDDAEVASLAPVVVMTAEPVAIPSNWRSLGPAQLKELAGRFSHPVASTKAAAIAAIEEELARRGEG